jgi:ubiquinone/menaquinone biosynthesis C-methylase UbiE
MNEQEQWQVDGGGAAAYQRYLVPLVTARWAVVLADRAALRPGERILDVACGTGAAARLAAERVGPSGEVTAVDINPEILAMGRSLPPVVGAPIDWRDGSAEGLPLPDGSFDAVLCQLGLQFFPDRLTALREMRRVLSPTGRVVASVYGPIAQNPANHALSDALDDRVAIGASRTKRSEHALGDPTELAELVAKAGFADVSVATDAITIDYDSPAEFVRIQLTATPLARLFADTPAAERERIMREVTADVQAGLAPYTDSRGLHFPQVAHHVSAVPRRTV